MLIYKAEFPNGKVYIGKTINLKSRIYNHIWNSKKDHNKHIIMYKAIRKYGEENIKWEILCECTNSEDMKEKEIFYIKKYNSTVHKFGYNMVCGDKEGYSKRENFDKDYQLDIIKGKLKSNGHDPDKYIVIDDELSKMIINDYSELGIRTLNKKYKISRQRLRRFLLSNNIEISMNKSTEINTKTFDKEYINLIINLYKSGKTIKQISGDENLTIMIISRILHDSGVRESKRFKNGKRYDGKQPKKRQLNN